MHDPDLVVSDVVVRNTRVPGHGLLREGCAFEAVTPDPWRPVPYMGRAFRYTGEAEGRAVCSCGDCSEVLPSTAARRRWHEEHKAEVRVRAALAGDTGED